jgi:hypothetical protein
VVDIIYLSRLSFPSLPNPAVYYATHSKILESQFSGNKSGMEEVLRLWISVKGHAVWPEIKGP